MTDIGIDGAKLTGARRVRPGPGLGSSGVPG